MTPRRGQNGAVELSSSGGSADIPELSRGERRVLEEARSGSTAGEIANRLSLSEATVRTHLSHIYAKVGVRGRLELFGRLQGSPTEPTPLSPEAVAGDRRLPSGVSPSRAAALGPIIMSVLGALVGALVGWTALPAIAYTPLALLLIPAAAGTPLAIAIARRPGGLDFFAAVAGVAGAVLVALAFAPGLSCPDGEFAATCTRPALAPILLPGLILMIVGLLIAGAAGRRRARDRTLPGLR